MLSPYLTLAIMLLLMGAIAAAGVVVAIAVALLRPPRMSDGKAVWVLRRLSPGDLGLAFTDVEFHIRDARTDKPMRIVGWWIPHAQARGRCVVLLHGYADAKVGSIAWAPLWHLMGFNVLAIDLRAHGYSDGTQCTAGYWERHDVSQVLDKLIAERAGDMRQIVLFGVSLGAATALAAAAIRDDIAAVVLESPPADFQRSAMSHMDRLGAPGRLFQWPAVWLAQRMAECDFASVQPAALIRTLNCPVMLVAPDDDAMVSEQDRNAMRDAQASRRRENDVYWTVSTGHMLALHAEMREYERRMREFLRVLENEPASSGRV